MPEQWYEIVGPDTPLTQGDLIFNCPIVAWAPGPVNLEGADESEALKGATSAIVADTVVMTQACDLEQSKVENVILCPHVSLSEHRSAWERDMGATNQNPTPKAWSGHCERICDGFIFNIMMLNSCETNILSIDIRIVCFHEVFTVPVSFLESLITQRNVPRFRLLPPYREHLSQAFARFFMRVGLPTPIQKDW